MNAQSRFEPLRVVARLACVAIATFAIGSACRPALASSSEDCLACHSDASLTMERGKRTVSLHVTSSVLEGSAHAGLDCTDCHVGFDPASLPHKTKIEPVDCESCHADAPEKHPFHPQMVSPAAPGTSCKGCHGTHDVIPPSQPGSKLSHEHVAKLCAKCHGEIAARYVESAHGKAAAAGQAHAPGCVDCHELPLTPARWKDDASGRKIAQEKMCLSCHRDDPEVRARMGPQAGFIAAYETSVHGAALLKGNARAANCVDCHGSHEMNKGFDPSSRVSKLRIPETCGACHGEIERQYAGSVHAAALERGATEAPVCTDCHGEHDILRHTDLRSPVAAANVAAQTCSPCHSSVKLSQKYGIPADRVRSFSDSFHGLALRGGSVEVANCASCHSAHEIRPSSDPASSVNRANLAKTCGHCHPGANEKFAVGAVHVVMTAKQEPVLYWIARLYVGMIVVVIGGMFLHNILDFLKRSRRRLAARRGGEPEGAQGARSLYLRMTVGERLQHGFLMLSFFVLVVTGFMLRYPDAWWVAGLRSLSGRLFDIRSALHRIAAVVLVCAGIWHIVYVVFAARGREMIRDIFPKRSDLTDALAVMRFNLGLSRRKPRFGRFSYIEKSEYWALVWGTIVMAVTGGLMWFENTSIGLLTKPGWDIARTIHFYEAWLATLAIVVWHLYYVLFNPDAYPMNMSWLTGTLTEKEMEEEHPLELEAIRREKDESARREREEEERRNQDVEAGER